jgi:heme-degrading monooxygenase HmoA
VIARIWRASATPEGAAGYRRHFTDAVLPDLERTSGFVGALLLEREDGERVEIQVITRWESLDAVRNFAGDDLDTAVVEPPAVAVLSEFDTTVTHHAVAVQR